MFFSKVAKAITWICDLAVKIVLNFQGKFNTNYLVIQLISVAMNLLRLIIQSTLNKPDEPVHHSAKRLTIKALTHELMFMAARMISHAGR